MMPTVNLPDVYDSKLKQLVTEPFEQTRESIIKDLIDAELERRIIKHSASPTNSDNEAIRLDPNAPGSLFHSKIISASINGKEMHKPKWNGIREQMHVIALKHLGSFEALQKASGARLRQGRYEAEGFKYVPEGDYSIQGVDANWCWEHTLQLAKVLECSVHLRIIWRDKDGAAHPGRTGLLEWQIGKAP
jgi:hypothetical protein